MIYRRLMWALAAGFWLAAGAAEGQTLSPQKVLGRYQQFIWQDRHGLPQNTITSMVRTRDGYLWLGTFEGAVRFDGMRFSVFDNGNTPAFRSNWINSVLEDRHGTLWFGTSRGGIVRLSGGVFTHYGVEDGLADDRVTVLFEDRRGTIWLGTQDGGLTRYRDGRFTTYTARDGLPAGTVRALAEDHDGNLWIGTSTGLATFHDDGFTSYATGDGPGDDDVLALCVDNNDRLWIGTRRGLLRRDKTRFIQAGPGEPAIDDGVAAIFQDREGSVWVGTREHGLYRFGERGVSNYSARDGLPGDEVLAIYQDPDGDLWIGTNGNGLSQFRDPRFRSITTANGLVHDTIRGIYQDSTGTVWIGTEHGLNRIVHGAITSYSTKDGLADDTVRSIAEDTAGGIWIGTLGGISRFRDGRFETSNSLRGLSNDIVVALLGDRDGNLWIGTERGLFRFRDGRLDTFTTADGLAADHVETLYEDRQGVVWIGTNSGGISRFEDGRFTSWSTKDGLSDNRVLTFYEDHSGGLWIGTHGGGLSRFKDGAFKIVTTRDGLYDNLAFRILEDNRGDVWMVCNRGIYRASVQALNDFADGKMTTVPSFAYGVADGMLSREGNGGSPAGWKTRDGDLWFPTAAGVAVINPSRQNIEPPLVAIESVTIDRHLLPPADVIRVMPGQENLEIQYSALSWARPQQIRFRYRLEGVDRDWVEAGTRRTAYYGHVPPGRYSFDVIADNGEGTWNTAGRHLSVSVEAAFYQTWWFSMLLVGGGGVALVAVVSQYRVRQFRRTEAAQHAFSRELIASQENERKRIAAELHDSLGQHLLIIKNRAVMGSAAAAAEGTPRTQFDEIAASAGHSLEEVRRIAYKLRPYHLDRLGLTQALGAMVDDVAASTGMRLEARLAPIDGVFPKNAEITIFRVVQESLNNIVKHSQASLGTITTSQQGNIVTIAIEDNGRGFDASALSLFRSGGFGLAGMAERVRILGGLHRIDSVPGFSTTVTITLDASTMKDDHGR